MENISSIKLHYKKVGLRNLLLKIVLKLTPTISYYSTFFYSKNIQLCEATPEPENFTIRKLIATDYEKLTSEKSSNSSNYINERLKNKEICYIANNDTDILGSTWVAFGPDKLQHEQHILELKKQQVYSHDSFTYKEHRGKGVFPYLMKHVSKEANEMGYQEIVAIIYYDNHASQKGVEKCGFIKTHIIHHITLKLFNKHYSFKRSL